MRPASPSGAGTSQQYVRGLRFDGQLQYRVLDRRRRKGWAALSMPWLHSPTGDDGGRLCLLQAATVLTHARAYVLPGPAPVLADFRALADWCALPTLSISAHVCEVDAATVGQTVRDILGAGGTCGLQLEAECGSRWVFVSGVEGDDVENGGNVRALLLIDAKAPSPWIAGYNARIDLQWRTPRNASFKSDKCCRTIHGGDRVSRLKRLLVVRRSVPKQPLDAHDEF